MNRAASRVVLAVAALLLGIGVLTAAVVAMREPFALNDYAAIWGLKARALYRSGSLAALFRPDPNGTFSHPEYPPLWPILLTVATRARLPYDDLVATPLWPILVLSASLLAVRAARSMRVPTPFAFLAGAAVSLLPYWRRYPGYAEGLLLVLLLAALAETVRLDTDRGAVVRLVLFLTLAAWTKPEGTAASLAAAAILLAAKRPRAGLLAGLSTLFFAVLPWSLTVALLDPAAPRTDFSLSSFSPGKAMTALGVLVREGLVPNAGWVAGAVVLLAMSPGTRTRRRGVLLWCALYVAGLVFSFAFSRLDPAWQMHWAWDRLLVVPAAATLVVLAEATAEILVPAKESASG